jgi:hypothetical protein
MIILAGSKCIHIIQPGSRLSRHSDNEILHGVLLKTDNGDLPRKLYGASGVYRFTEPTA